MLHATLSRTNDKIGCDRRSIHIKVPSITELSLLFLLKLLGISIADYK